MFIFFSPFGHTDGLPSWHQNCSKILINKSFDERNTTNLTSVAVFATQDTWGAVVRVFAQLELVKVYFLPLNLVPDLETVKKLQDMGATHIITSIVYGGRALLKFESKL